MTTTRAALTDEDIRTLVKGATPDERARAARKLCANMEGAPLSEAERAMAADILRVMAADAAELVRTAITETLKASPLVPRDVAIRLSRDVESVCLPLLSFSPAFTDADLAEIVRLGDRPPGRHREAAGDRSERHARLAEHGGERAVAAACENPGADSRSVRCNWWWIGSASRNGCSAPSPIARSCRCRQRSVSSRW